MRVHPKDPWTHYAHWRTLRAIWRNEHICSVHPVLHWKRTNATRYLESLPQAHYRKNENPALNEPPFSSVRAQWDTVALAQLFKSRIIEQRRKYVNMLGEILNHKSACCICLWTEIPQNHRYMVRYIEVSTFHSKSMIAKLLAMIGDKK